MFAYNQVQYSEKILLKLEQHSNNAIETYILIKINGMINYAV